VHPVYKRVDTCAAEFKAKTPYMYSTYEMPSFGGEVACEAGVSSRKKVIILGGGPNRIGQGIERLSQPITIHLIAYISSLSQKRTC